MAAPHRMHRRARYVRAGRAWLALRRVLSRCATRRDHARWPCMVAGQGPLASRTRLRSGRVAARGHAPWISATMCSVAFGLLPFDGRWNLHERPMNSRGCTLLDVQHAHGFVALVAAARKVHDGGRRSGDVTTADFF
ncbi:disease resistance protein [Dorcoceras hygrometricum]|uniref:Disease resistance protein n=1 Tax=Dorcoceras hygrometricum TaxID=472368 RepID=A0A2Z7A2P5_9LAMI|nr:disease resistance protein [Dorcoceras hygrometricum]